MILCKYCETELEGFENDSCCDDSRAKQLEAEVARLRDILESVMSFNHTPHNIIGYIERSIKSQP